MITIYNFYVMYKFKLFLFFLLFALNTAVAQHLIPTPKSMTYKSNKTFEITTVDAKVNPRLSLPDEGYTLEIKRQKAILRAKTSQGLVWAKATLSQLMEENGKCPEVYIKDYPSFPIRGFMHDTGRNFRPIELLKKELDLLSQYKVNVFHWHLTDNPAWRIECRVYPELNDPAFQVKGRDEGKFYSYKEIHELIAYAKERGITIIPEIDMPGHSRYFLATFGCSMASDKGREILEKCLDEFFDEITKAECPYFHIGSDEVHVDNPKQFMEFCEKIVMEHGRIPLCWNPGLPPSPTTITQIWYASIGKKLKKENYTNPYIDSYHGYLNSGNPILNTSKYFLHQACGREEATEQARGGILCLWNDVRIDHKELLFAHNGMPNGLLAFAESFWCGGKGVDIDDENLLPASNTKEYEELMEFENRLSYHRDHFLYDWDMRWVANAQQVWKVTLPQPRGTSIDEMKWSTVWGGVIDMVALCEKYKVELRPTMDAWMTTEIYSPADTVLKAWVGFDTPGRATKKSAGIGYQGYWEADGRVFVNGNEIFPKKWKEPGKFHYNFDTWFTPQNEIPYSNEQFSWMREPAELPLKSGWNKIKLYCPKVLPGESWSVTFIPVHIDAKGHVSEVKGIRWRN